MNTKEIIGRVITDILVWSKIEVGGLDEAEVYLYLDNGKIIGFPWDFETEELERQPEKYSESLFSNLNDANEFYINTKKKKIQKILNDRGEIESTFWYKFKKLLGFREGINREYKIFTTESKENKLKHLKNQKIVDFLMFDNSDSVGFIELENGYIITETIVSPHGTGMSGLNFYENLKSFENNCGTDYKRLKNNE